MKEPYTKRELRHIIICFIVVCALVAFMITQSIEISDLRIGLATCYDTMTFKDELIRELTNALNACQGKIWM